MDEKDATMSGLFDSAARVFAGWTDDETGARMLRLDTRPERDPSEIWQTIYHQFRCFLDGGRRVLLRKGPASWWLRQGGGSSIVLNLVTGEVTNPFPDGYNVVEVCDATNVALLAQREREDAITAVLWDLRAGKILASVPSDGWQFGGMASLADGRRAVVSHFRGRPYNEPTQSHFHLLSPDEPPRVILEADQYFCNHIQGYPTDPEMYSYDRWPSPKRDVEQAIHIASLDGSFHEPVKLDARALRSGDMFGARDHYIWTPDGKRIISYLNPQTVPEGLLSGEKATCATDFNHFLFPWVLSALDWRTGADFAAPYPAGRWGGHMNVTPDGRYMIAGGGPGFDYLYAVEIEALRDGWNEHILCGYPKTVSQGKNFEPFAYPFVLPDGSGVIFNAGWPGPEHGVYLVEWPKTLR